MDTCPWVYHQFTLRKSVFEGAVQDTGAARTVIGRPQAQAYMRSISRKRRANPSRGRFKFGDSIVESLGSVAIRIPFCGSFIVVEAKLVPLDVHFLVGLDALGQHALDIDISGNKFTRRVLSKSLIRSRAHLVYEVAAIFKTNMLHQVGTFRSASEFCPPLAGKTLPPTTPCPPGSSSTTSLDRTATNR
jgi:hypothetical protein